MFKKWLEKFFGEKEVTGKLPDNHPDIIEAKKTAKPMIDEFLALLANPQEGMTDFEIKVAFELNHGYEDLWVNQISLITNVYHAILDDDPHQYEDKKPGQAVSFQKKDVVDWGYSLGGVCYGYFTTKAQIPHMLEPERSELILQYGWQQEFEVIAPESD